MKTWTYFYIEHTIKNGEVFRKESGWALFLSRDMNKSNSQQGELNG